MLTREGYEFNEHVSVRDSRIDFVAWQPPAPDHVLITLTAAAADLTMAGKILALLGRYRKEQSPNALAWSSLRVSPPEPGTLRRRALISR
jgi:hypothetical protein